MDSELLIQLSAYADGELEGPARAALEQQLGCSPHLAHELELIRRLDQAAAALPEPHAAWAGWVSPAHAYADAGARRLERAAEVPAPEISAEKFASVWQHIARQTVSPAASERALMAQSAAFDGEGEGRSDEGLARIWKLLDEAASTLPVPQLSALAAAETFHDIAARTTQITATERQAWARLEQAAAASPDCPQVSDEKFQQVWLQIAQRTAAAAHAPRISDERWGSVWQGIQTRVQRAQSRPLEKRSSLRRVAHSLERHRRAWIWSAVASVATAAVITLALLLQVKPPATEQEVAFEITAPDDDYHVHVRYVVGHSEPTVCYLKNPQPPGPVAPEAPPKYRWLPY